MPRKSAPVQNARPDPVKIPTERKGLESIHCHIDSSSQ